MAYRRPAVTVTQEFVGLQPAIAAIALQSVLVGPAFQLLFNDNLGTYDGSENDYAYAGMSAGFIPDLSAADLVTPIISLPISVSLKTIVKTVHAQVTSTSAPVDALNFVHSAADFTDVLPGDKLVIYSGANTGSYTVKSVVSATQLALQSPLPSASTSSNPYSVDRALAGPVVLDSSNYTSDLTGITLNANIELDGLVVKSAVVLATYRALRNDVAADVVEFSKLAAVQAFFGLTQITPANTLAYGLQLALQNTVTPVNGLGLDENALSDEVTSFQSSLDVLKVTEMYALAPLTQNPVVGQLFTTHVTQMSGPTKGKERACIINRKLITTEILQDDLLVSSSTSGARIVVNTQTAGASTSPNFNRLASSSLFANVSLGDKVVVTGGTNAIVGTYTVTTKTDSSNLVLSGNVASGTSSTINYFIVRLDGLASDGQDFYDRNATFITNGVSPGHFLNVVDGNYPGRYKITQIVSELELKVAQIPGVTTSQSGVNYFVDRNLTRTEQAQVLADYSASIGNRRVVNLWPDILKAPVGNILEPVPGYFGCGVIAALTTGLPSQQGFTNLAISGFLGVSHSSKYFDDDQLDTIAGGGTMILAQDGPDQPLYVRHQLTTDTSAIKFQEYSLTKNIDFSAKLIRLNYKRFLGQYNIIQSTIDELRLGAKALIVFMKEKTKLPKIGGVIKDGSLKSVAEDPDQIDSINMVFGLDYPIPLNNVNVTIQA